MSKRFFMQLVIALLLALPVECFSQSLDWNLSISKPKTFTTLNPVDDPDIDVTKMHHISISDMMDLNKGHGLEIYLNDQNTGYGQVSVYIYDTAFWNHPDQQTDSAKEAHGYGPLIYQSISKRSSSANQQYIHDTIKYNLGNWLAWWPDQEEEQSPFYFNEYWNSPDIKTSGLKILTCDFDNLFNNNAPKSLSFKPNGKTIILPVVIQVTVFKANVKSIFIPNMGVIDPATFNPPYLNANINNENHQPRGIEFTFTLASPPANTPYHIDFGDINLKLSPLNKDNVISSIVIPRNQIAFPNGDPFRKSTSIVISKPLDQGAYGIWAEYDITVTDERKIVHSYHQRQFLYNYRVLDPEDLLNYEVYQDNYKGLKVYTLRGGMSAEYAVEKSIADLSSGISETWDARDVNGHPDLADGGPVSVYPDYEKKDYSFLKKSVSKTVELYNSVFGATKRFETVIISTGVAHVPYLSSAMKSPVLPLHFLVSINSVRDVKNILDRGKSDGYSCYSTLGYDPSMKDIGVAWIKLRDIPAEYLDFLRAHSVRNVIIMGFKPDENSGETQAARIHIEGQDSQEFSEGSMYMMTHENLKTYKSYFKDYYTCTFEQEIYIPDWEGGVSVPQLKNFSNAIRHMPGPGSPPQVFSYLANSSVTFYRWAMDLQLYMLKKYNAKPTMVSLNEYLIGYPAYELSKGVMPYLYWQGIPVNLTAFQVNYFGGFKVKYFFGDQFDYKNLPVYIQAKANRTKLLDSLKRYFPNVTMNSWQKADVWDPSDGMDAPCEIAAMDIVKNGVDVYVKWNTERDAFDLADLNLMMDNSIRPDHLPYSQFPVPTKTQVIQDFPDAGINVTNYSFDVNNYWHPENFPNEIEVWDMNDRNNPYPGKILGYLDEQNPSSQIRKQNLTILQIDLNKKTDEFDLNLHYKFNVSRADGLSSYNPSDREQQNMNCFEFTSVPYNHWMDIPSRVMAKYGALMVFNGSVYDFDYNGIPGVVPFIKTRIPLYGPRIKAQPQILSYKGEGVFVWDWSQGNRRADILPRKKDIPPTNLAQSLRELFHTETEKYIYAMGGMTYMTKNSPYNHLALQPDWMKNYPAFPSYYMAEGKTLRCYLAPISRGCAGAEVTAPVDLGFNDCSRLSDDKFIQRFSTLAYRQYPKFFDDVPNARTFVGIKGNQLDIGIIDGDLGNAKSLEGLIATKQFGMHNYEVSQFCQWRGYDKFVNLDGGSSTQMWINGRGPMHLLNGYKLSKDNQGPYYSRLVSSFVLLVPKLHVDQLKKNLVNPNDTHELLLPNADNGIGWNYDDKTDTKKPKAFIDLTPYHSLFDYHDAQGMIATRFKVFKGNFGGPNGMVLFYYGEDMHYPDTKGLETVVPSLNNIMVVGMGNVIPSLLDSLKHIDVAGDGIKIYDFKVALAQNDDISFYYVKIAGGRVVEYFIEYKRTNPRKIFDNKYHSFAMFRKGTSRLEIMIDNISLFQGNEYAYGISTENPGFFDVGEVTHLLLGSVNLDGRFLTGNANLTFTDYLIGNDQIIKARSADELRGISTSLTDNQQRIGQLPAGLPYSSIGYWAFQFAEKQGMHVFMINNDVFIRGLKLNTISNVKPTVR